MADPLQKIKDEIIAATTAKHPDVLVQVKMEVTLAAMIEAIDGKGTALNTIYSIWKANPSKKGTLNKSNSWIAYGVGMTNMRPMGDPLPYRRAFARAGFPDIDSDFEDDRREEIIQHIVDTYGRENVGNIGTYGTLHMKSVVRSLVKVIDAAGSFYKGKDNYRTDNKVRGDEIIAALPKPQGSKIKWTDDEGHEVEIKTVADAYKYVPDFRQWLDKYPDIMKYAKHIEGLSSQFSTHASGVIIANEPLCGLAPMRPVEKKNWRGEIIRSYSTQFAYEDCETIGLIKFDVLAIKMLSIVKGALKLIKKNWDIDIDIENLPLTDQKTFRMFQTGNLTGVFQCEGFGMMKTCRDMGISTFDDIMAAIALYRPGPMASIPEYVARKRGEKPVEYFHPSLEKFTKKVLERTFGLLVYQEQVMLLCNALAGFSISDAYQIIKAIGKKKMDLMLKFRAQFVDGCVNKGIDRGVAEQYWDKFIVPFADYGFNASMTIDTKVVTPTGVATFGDLHAGDEVMAVWEDGEIRPTKIVQIHDHGELNAFKVAFDDGSSVVCSENHKFLTPDGQVSLKRIFSEGLMVLADSGRCDQYASSKTDSGTLWSTDPTEVSGEASPSLMRSVQADCVEEEHRELGLCLPMRGNLFAVGGTRKSSAHMRGLLCDKGGEYSGPNGQAESRQPVTGSEGDFLCDCEENIGTAGRSTSSGRSVEGVAREQFRYSVREHQKGSGFTKELSLRGMVADAARLAFNVPAVWGGQKTSRSRSGERVDRSGRILPLFQESTFSSPRTKAKDVGECAGKGPNAECGVSSSSDDHADSDWGRLLHEFDGNFEAGVVGLGAGHAPITDTRSLVSRKVVRVVPVGKRRLYDLEVACSTHNFVLANGVVTSNSHSCCYGYNSYLTAYLKANYRVEYLTASLNVESERKKWEKVWILEKDCHRNGIELVKRDINKCGMSYEILSHGDAARGVKAQVRPSILCQGLSHQAAENIVANAPYTSLRDFSSRTASCVDTTSVASLAEAGFFPKGKGDQIVREFESLRTDLKKMRKKGMDSQDMFEDL